MINSRAQSFVFLFKLIFRHLSQTLGQRCTTSGPRATSGPRRVLMWPATSSRKIDYFRAVMLRYAMYVTVNIIFIHFDMHSFDMSYILTLVWPPKGLKNRLVARCRKRLCTTDVQCCTLCSVVENSSIVVSV